MKTVTVLVISILLLCAASSVDAKTIWVRDAFGNIQAVNIPDPPMGDTDQTNARHMGGWQATEQYNAMLPLMELEANQRALESLNRSIRDMNRKW